MCKNDRVISIWISNCEVGQSTLSEYQVLHESELWEDAATTRKLTGTDFPNRTVAFATRENLGFYKFHIEYQPKVI